MYELAAIIVLGILAQWFAWKTKVPAILPLILIGLIVGPISTYFTNGGHKWIEPVYNETIDHGLFPGDLLYAFVNLSIGIILFEGGMTLKIKEIKGIGSVILKMLFWGIIITTSGGALFTHYIVGLNWTISLLFASLIIVTGPTVIAPILRNISLKKNVAAILKWEGILVDPFGALVAIMFFEFIMAGAHQHEFIREHAFQTFAKTIITGVSVGFTAAYALRFLIKYKLVPDYLINILTLGLVLAIFVASDFLAEESGLLSVVVMGMVLANFKLEHLKSILHFKESLTLILISILFILLAANINIEDLEYIFTWKVALLFLILILVIRPLMVFISTIKSGLNTNEKLFISWVGPRGIVAAGIASLFGMKLTGVVPGAEYLTPLVFMVVLGTVLINASTAKFIAKKLGVSIDNPDGVLICGANKASRLISKYLNEKGKHAVLVDQNKLAIERAKNAGLEALEVDLFNDELGEIVELNDIGYILAFTASSDVNKFVMEKYVDKFGEQGTYRLITAEELKQSKTEKIKDLEDIFSFNDDFINMVEIARDHPFIYEIEVDSKEHFYDVFNKVNECKYTIPLFFLDSKKRLNIIPADLELIEVKDKSTLVYMGDKELLEQDLSCDITSGDSEKNIN